MLKGMNRIKPSTVSKVESIANDLRDVADDFELARPNLAPLFRDLAGAIETATLIKKGADFHLMVSKPQYFECLGRSAWVRRKSS